MVANNLHSILANQTNVTLARSQRLVASWLPPPSSSEIQQLRVGAEPDEEEEGQAFVPELEFLGLGQALPKDVESAQASNPSSDAKLRRQLLGRNHDKLKRPSSAHAKGPRLPAAKPRYFKTDTRLHESSSEDEPGRSALGRPALAKPRQRTSSEDEITNNLEGHTGRDDTSNASQQSLSGERRRKVVDVGPKHYLDQVLAEKARKMRKRRKRDMRKEKMQRAGEAGGTEGIE